MHRQDDPGLKLVNDRRGILLAHGPGAIDRDHHDVDMADRVDVGRRQQMVQVTEVRDAQSACLEDKN